MATTNGNYDIDLAYTSAVIDDLAKTYNADRTRIYAGGYSMGGSYVWDLACVKSDEIAASGSGGRQLLPVDVRGV